MVRDSGSPRRDCGQVASSYRLVSPPTAAPRTQSLPGQSIHEPLSLPMQADDRRERHEADFPDLRDQPIELSSSTPAAESRPL